MQPILNVAVPLFTIIIMGIIIGRLGIIPATDSNILNRFVFKVAMPVALFGFTARSDPLRFDDLSYTGVFAICVLTTLGLSYLIARRAFHLPRPDAGLHALAGTLGNAVFLGLPIAQGIEGWGRPYIVLMLTEGILVLTTASILIAARVDEELDGLRVPLREILLRPVKNPLVIGPLLGFLYGMTGIGFVMPIDNFLTIFSPSAGAVALFSLGLFLSSNSITRHEITSTPMLQIILFKLIVLPTLVFIGLNLIGRTSPDILGPLMLFTFVPTGIAVYIQATARERYIEQVATAIAITTLIPILTIGGVLYLYA